MNTSTYYNARLRKFALARLETITSRRREKAREISYLRELGVITDSREDGHDLQLHLLDRAIYSVYLDCVDAGADGQAREMLDDLRHVTHQAALTV